MTREDNSAHDGAVEWAALTVDELRSALEAGAVGLWAIGATEQHGRHLVTGFDHLVADAIVRGAAAALGPAAVVLPTLPIGSSAHWLDIGGTLSLSVDTMRRVVLDVCGSAASAGLRNLVIVNGHSGNTAVGISAVQEFGTAELMIEFVSYWDMLDRERLLDLQDLEDGFGHAGELETSIGMHLDGLARAELVPPGTALDPRAPGGARVVFHRAPRAIDDTHEGVIGEAGAASATLGSAAIDMAVSRLALHCRELRARRMAVLDERVG
jgi:creatinine amidohydrolase